MNLKLIQEPAGEPLTRSEIKTHLSLDGTDHDTIVDDMIRKWRKSVDGKDGWLNRALITQTWDVYLDKFPCSARTPVYLPLPPLQSVTHIKYYDTDGILQTWSAANYVLDTVSEPAKIYPAYNVSWPTVRDMPNAVQIRMICGYGDNADDVPESLRYGGCAQIALMFANREGDPLGNADASLRDYKVRMPEGWEESY